jgi:lipopolysaccharide export system permease protein
MSSARIHRYLFREITVPAVLGLVIFTFVLFMGRILRLVEMVVNKGVPPLEIVKLFLFLLPTFLVITLPLAFLLGVLLGFGRLSADSELIALKASGVSLYGMMKPVLLFAVVTSLATGFMTIFAQPAGTSAFRTQVFEIAASRASIGIQPRVFNEEFDGLVIYANDVHERTGHMRGVLISDERLGTSPTVIFAEAGRIISNQEELILTLRLEEGSIHRSPPGHGPEIYQTINFELYDIILDFGRELANAADRPRKIREMSLTELRHLRQETDVATERRAYTVEIHKRFILPATPLLFALIGVPLGIQSSRSGRGGGFAIGLFIFLLYYILFSFSETLAVEAGFPPVVTMWIPSVLFLGGGIHLLHLAAIEKRLVFLDHLTEMFQRLIRRIGRKV